MNPTLGIICRLVTVLVMKARAITAGESCGFGGRVIPMSGKMEVAENGVCASKCRLKRALSQVVGL